MQATSSRQGNAGTVQILFGLSGIRWKHLAGYCLLVALAAALLLTSFSPQPTAGLGFGLAALSWFLHFLAAIAIVLGLATLALRMGLRAGSSLALAVLGLPLFLAPVSYLADRWFSAPANLPSVDLVTGLWAEFLAVTPPALACGAVLVFGAYRITRAISAHRRLLETVSTQEPDLQQALPLVPHRLGNDLIRLEAQGHYVKVVTAAGSALIKQPFSSCVAALADFKGTQCHRSHWMRLKHAQGLRRSGSAYVCRLSNEEEIPVSRRKYGELRQRI